MQTLVALFFKTSLFLTTSLFFRISLNLKTSLFFTVLLFFATLPCRAQIPVSKEPRHHNVFENPWVRVLDVHIPPGDTSLFHKHETPSVFIVLTNAKSGSELLSKGTITNAPVTYGNIWFDGFYTSPRIHRVWNSDTMEFHVMDIELLNKQYTQIDTTLKKAPFQYLFDEKPVRAYRLNLRPQTAISLKEQKAPVLVVGLTDSVKGVTVNSRTFGKKGDFLFIRAGERIDFINKGTSIEDLAFFELK